MLLIRLGALIMTDTFMKHFLYLLLSGVIFNSYGQNTALQLQKTITPLVIDGILDPVEWKDAVMLSYSKSEQGAVNALVTYDNEYLYIAFRDLIDANKRKRNAEVLIHTKIEGDTWDANSFWFHASYGNCSAVGDYYVWKDCFSNRKRWKASRFSSKNDEQHIEFRISFEKLGIKPYKGMSIKMALKTSDPLEQHEYWPKAAAIENPGSWGTIKF